MWKSGGEVEVVVLMEEDGSGRNGVLINGTGQKSPGCHVTRPRAYCKWHVSSHVKKVGFTGEIRNLQYLGRHALSRRNFDIDDLERAGSIDLSKQNSIRSSHRSRTAAIIWHE
jgi:hypothetical protein